MITLDHENSIYTSGETITITGSFAVPGVKVIISIFDPDGNQVASLEPRASENGDF